MASALIHIRLKQAAESRVRGGHPWVYSDSIVDQSRAGTAGELVTIFDRHDRFLALGLFDPESPMRVRIIHRGKPRRIDEQFWREGLDQALKLRQSFPETTNGYRLIHGENDGFPGLVLDRYHRTLVVKLYSAIWFPHWKIVLHELQRRFPDFSIVLRLSRNIQTSAALLDLRDGQILAGSTITGPVPFTENGIIFEADVLKGQKTGFFLDQRENRERVEKLAAGKTVLNAFSFSGGFSLYAARGRATQVTSLDISAHALQSALRNFDLNPSLPATKHSIVQADVFEWLKQGGQNFHLIILDPPSLAKRETERAGAIHAYQNLASDGIARLHPNGILVAASCSAHVSSDEFFTAVLRAASKSGRSFEELDRTGQPMDHPATFNEARYLKCIYLKFDGRPATR